MPKENQLKQESVKQGKLNAYLAVSKSNRSSLNQEVNSIKEVLKCHEIRLEVFVDKYKFTKQEEKEMMAIAFEEIDKCDLLIAELSKKAIGVGLEVGYAKAKNKTIIYIKKKVADYSTTVGGSADYLIEYKDNKELMVKLGMVIKQIEAQKK